MVHGVHLGALEVAEKDSGAHDWQARLLVGEPWVRTKVLGVQVVKSMQVAALSVFEKESRAHAVHARSVVADGAAIIFSPG